MSAGVETKGAVTIRTFRPGDDQAIVDLLNAAYPGGWGTLERWRAKHSGRPGFDPQDIYLAELDGRIVGCLHTAMLPVRITEGVTLPLSLDGDLAVHPDARGHSVPEILYAESRRHLYARGIPLRGGYTETGLWTRFYRPRIGYVSDFDRTVNYKKVLDAAPVRNRLLALFGGNPDSKDPGKGPALQVDIVGLPPFQIRLGPGAVSPIADGARVRAAVTLAADQRLFGAFGSEGQGVRGLAGLWRQGGLRLRGGLPGLFRAGWWYVTSGRRLMRRPASKS